MGFWHTLSLREWRENLPAPNSFSVPFCVWEERRQGWSVAFLLLLHTMNWLQMLSVGGDMEMLLSSEHASAQTEMRRWPAWKRAAVQQRIFQVFWGFFLLEFKRIIPSTVWEFNNLWSLFEDNKSCNNHEQVIGFSFLLLKFAQWRSLYVVLTVHHFGKSGFLLMWGQESL